MQDFAGAYGECMYLLDMAIRPEALPTDAVALTEMVLALDAENEKLRVAMLTLKDMIFGKRSERLAVEIDRLRRARSFWLLDLADDREFVVDIHW